GAQLLRSAAGPAAMAVLGHHGGLPDLYELRETLQQAQDCRTADRFFAVVPEARDVLTEPVLMPDSWRSDLLVTEMGIRLAFSALVDADHLDTAAHSAGSPVPAVS